MRPYDEIPFEESDYSDVALLVAGVREFPSEDFARELDARVAQRFAPEAAPRVNRTGRGRLSIWMAGVGGTGIALVAGATTAVVLLSSGGSPALMAGASSRVNQLGATGKLGASEKPVIHGIPYRNLSTSHSGAVNTTASSSGGTTLGQESLTTAGAGLPAATGASSNSAAKQATTLNGAFSNSTTSAPAPYAPGSKQIRSAQITLSTSNQHVDQVATQVFTVVGAEHGSVLRSHIVSATNNSGGGYASFSLSIPTGNLQDAMTQLSRLHYAAVSARVDDSQNVSGQYNNDQRQLADAEALRASLLKQLQTAYTTQSIDSIKAQLKLAEQQISSWQKTVNSLNHQISYSNLTVQVNAGGLPVVAHHSSSFTIGRAAHDALRVLVVAAGVALIALAVAIPIGLVAALLMWLWVWLRQRRREHALDATA